MSPRERKARELVTVLQDECELHRIRYSTSDPNEAMDHWHNYEKADRGRKAALAALLRVVREEARRGK